VTESECRMTEGQYGMVIKGVSFPWKRESRRRRSVLKIQKGLVVIPAHAGIQSLKFRLLKSRFRVKHGMTRG